MANPYDKNKTGMMGRADASSFPTPMSKAMAMQPRTATKPAEENYMGGGMVKKPKKRKGYMGGGKVRKMYAKGGGIRKPTYS